MHLMLQPAKWLLSRYWVMSFALLNQKVGFIVNNSTFVSSLLGCCCLTFLFWLLFSALARCTANRFVLSTYFVYRDSPFECGVLHFAGLHYLVEQCM